MPGGSCRNVLEIAACTSCAAASICRDSENVSVMLLLPMVLDDVIASIPAIVENCFSSGVATAAAIVCGLAPGKPAETVERALDGDRLRRGGAVVGHDEHIGALLALHHGLARNDDRVVLDAEDERDADELTGPQAAVTILETGLEQHGPGGRVDLIVDERENALDGRRGV